jgi:hypothetical protein
MKNLLLLLAFVLVGGSLAMGQTTTMPAAQAPVKVLVIPFTRIGETGSHEWIGAAIQESLLTEASGGDKSAAGEERSLGCNGGCEGNRGHAGGVRRFSIFE